MLALTLIMSSLPHADNTQGGNGKCLDRLDYSVHSKKKTTNIKIMNHISPQKAQILSIKHDKGPNGGAEKLKEKSQ